jgi:hypothetical protein
MKRDFLDYKIIFHCKKCHKRIQTSWDGFKITGDFNTDDVEWSEVLEVPVSYPDQVICKECLNKK